MTNVLQLQTNKFYRREYHGHKHARAHTSILCANAWYTHPHAHTHERLHVRTHTLAKKNHSHNIHIDTDIHIHTRVYAKTRVRLYSHEYVCIFVHVSGYDVLGIIGHKTNLPVSSITFAGICRVSNASSSPAFPHLESVHQFSFSTFSDIILMISTFMFLHVFCKTSIRPSFSFLIFQCPLTSILNFSTCFFFGNMYVFNMSGCMHAWILLYLHLPWVSSCLKLPVILNTLVSISLSVFASIPKSAADTSYYTSSLLTLLLSTSNTTTHRKVFSPILTRGPTNSNS